MEINATSYVAPSKVAYIRKELGLRTNEFAELCGVNIKTVERWEKGETKVTGTAAVFLNLLYDNPSIKNFMIIDEKPYDLRIKIYECKSGRLLSVLDIREEDYQVKLVNYTSREEELPFGNKKEITYSEYDEFIRSFCPENMGKGTMLNPIEILKKTGGNSEYRIEIEE